MAKNILKKEIKSEIKEIKKADIVVGIPSFNNAKTISHVVRAVSAGLAKYFSNNDCILVNSDGGSTDGTTDLFKKASLEDLKTLLIEHPVPPLHKIITPYAGIPGKGSALRTIFELVSFLEAKACAVVDSDLRSITPEWIELLIEPVLYHSFDFVAPLYQRHKYDGTITNSIIYPLTRALYGKRIRQPIGGEFGFSGKLASFFLSQKKVFDTDIARYGIDIWMTTTAIAEDFKVCQSFLGAKIHDPKDPSADLASMLSQVTASVFFLMEKYYPRWSKITNSEPVPEFGFKFEVGLEPVRINLERMVDGFRQGVFNLAVVWKKILDENTLKELGRIASYNILEFKFPQNLWVKIVYDFALAYHRKVMAREHILRSLTPLYLGRVASFVNETLESKASEIEEKIEQVCLEFERQKKYLIDNWE